MTDDERLPESEPSGAPVPTTGNPSAALALTTPLSPLRWSDDDAIAARELFARIVRDAFDALDNVGASIASAVGLR